MNTIIFSVETNDINQLPRQPFTITVKPENCDNLTDQNIVNDYTKYALSLADRSIKELELTAYDHIPCPDVSLTIMSAEEALQALESEEDMDFPIAMLNGFDRYNLPDTGISVSLDAQDAHKLIGGLSQPHVLLATHVFNLLKQAMQTTGLPITDYEAA